MNSFYLRCFFFSLTTLFQPALEGTDQSQGSRAVLMTGTETFSGSLFLIYIYYGLYISILWIYQSCTYLKSNERGRSLHIANIQLGGLDGAPRGKAFSLIQSLFRRERLNMAWAAGSFLFCLLLYCIIHTLFWANSISGRTLPSFFFPPPLVIARVALLTVVQIFSMICTCMSATLNKAWYTCKS